MLKVAGRRLPEKLLKPQTQKPPQQPSEKPPPEKLQKHESTDDEAVFDGKVKSFNANSGYGFIECEATFDLFGHDVYLPKGVASQLEPGQDICFRLGVNDDDMPIVTAVWNPGETEEAAAAGAEDEMIEEMTGGELAMTEAAEGEGEGEGETFVGEVARYDMALGRGFIVCDGVNDTFGTDVYVHRNVLAKTRATVGDIVRFKIHVNSRGEPQASHPMEVIGSNGPKFENQGKVKSFSEKTGYGFIDCPPVREEYGRDVYLPGSKAKGCYVGQEVFFKFDLNNDSMPVVAEIYPAVIELDDKGGKGAKGSKDSGGKGDKASSSTKGDGESKGYGLQGGKAGSKGGKSPVGAAPAGGKGGGWGMPDAWGDDWGGCWSMPMKGAKGCKGWGESGKGWGDDWGGKGWGDDCWVMLDPWGKGEKGWGKMMMAAGKGWDQAASWDGGGGGAGGVKRKWEGAQEGRQKKIAAGKEVFVGEVVRYDMCGRGFIESLDAMASYGKEVYVHQNTLATSNANVGDEVRFSIHVNSKGEPQAEAPLEVIRSNGPKLPHKGVIKSYSEKTGYGFVSCPPLKEQYGRDVYLPSSKTRGIYVGQEIYFNIDENAEGMPICSDLYPVHIEMLNAEQQAATGGKGQKGGKFK